MASTLYCQTVYFRIFMLTLCRNKVYIQREQGRNHASKVGGPNRAKTESRAQSARDLRAKPESRAKTEEEQGRGLGRKLGESLPDIFLEFRTSNRSIWCIVQREILK